jgi:hypothetical protein
MDWVLKLWPEDRQDKRMIAVALLMAAITGHFLFLYRSEFGAMEGAVFIGVLQSDNPVRIRHSRSLQWGTVEKGSRIYLKDTVFTPKNTVAEFQWKDKKIILEPESLVQFDEASLENLEITLLEGSVKTDAQTKKVVKVAKVQKPSTVFFKSKTLPYLADINSFVSTQSELSSRTLDRLSQKIKLEPILGVTVPKLSLNQLTDYRLVLKSPQSQTYELPQGAWFSFEWADLPFKDLGYEIQVDVSDKFEHPIGTKTRVSQAKILFESPRTYWWRVVATRKAQSFVSEAKSFILDIKKGATTPGRNLTTSEKTGRTHPKKSNMKELSPFEIMFGTPSEEK